jgi:hypothetical protein
MDNIESMQVGNSTDNLFEVAACLFLLYFGILYNVVKQLSIFDVFHDQKQMPTSLYNFIELDDGWMSY